MKTVNPHVIPRTITCVCFNNTVCFNCDQAGKSQILHVLLMCCSPEFNKQMLYGFCGEIAIGSQDLSWAFTKFGGQSRVGRAFWKERDT